MQIEDVLISGAGPAGIAASLFLSRNKIKHTIVDKAVFPRDKVCGDALSGKVVHILKKLNPDFVSELSMNTTEFTGSYGICFFSPDGNKLEVPFSTNPAMLKNAPGFVGKRIHFDNYLFRKLDQNFANIQQSTELIDLERENGFVTATFKNLSQALRQGSGQDLRQSSGQTYQKKFRIVIGADGDRSIVAKKLDPLQKDLSFYCAALRAYYTGVTDTHDKKFIELHFLKELLPGYFWIFPMNDGTANVGIGMLSEVIAEKKISLRKKLEEIVANHPVISKRFKDAKLEGTVDGWGLPLGSAKRSLAGDNYVLLGDAGSLIDPFTGEGIGNAMLSGMIAAETVTQAITMKKYGKEILLDYEKKLYKNLNDELRLSHGIQKLSKYSWLFNYVVRKATRNKMLRETITCMFDDLDIRSRLRKPSFYFKLLFN